jgi:hypothetical protein
MQTLPVPLDLDPVHPCGSTQQPDAQQENSVCSSRVATNKIPSTHSRTAKWVGIMSSRRSVRLCTTLLDKPGKPPQRWKNRTTGHRVIEGQGIQSTHKYIVQFVRYMPHDSHGQPERNAQLPNRTPVASLLQKLPHTVEL